MQSQEPQQPPTLLDEVEQHIAWLNAAWRLLELFEETQNKLGIRAANRRIMRNAEWLAEHGVRDLIDLLVQDDDPDSMQFALPDWLREDLKGKTE